MLWTIFKQRSLLGEYKKGWTTKGTLLNIRRGDLNFTTSSREIWGVHAKSDPLHTYFNQLIQEEGLVDVEPVKLLPTWRNDRRGQDHIAKRLDRFLISEDLALLGLKYNTCLCQQKISDHVTVVLHMEIEQGKVKYPFKFNSIWLQDLELVNFVRNHWIGILGAEVLNPMDTLTKRLKLLKGLVIKWERKKKMEAKGELIKLEQ